MIERKERLKSQRISFLSDFNTGLADLSHTYSTVLSVSRGKQNMCDARDHIFFSAERLFLLLYGNFWHALHRDSLSWHYKVLSS